MVKMILSQTLMERLILELSGGLQKQTQVNGEKCYYISSNGKGAASQVATCSLIIFNLLT